MGNGAGRKSGWVLLTGATGFLGQCLLGELLGRGQRVLCVVRAATPEAARRRLAAAMRPWGRAAEAYLESGRVGLLRGDLHRPLLGLERGVVKRLAGSLAAVVHAAGNTVFRARSDGEPARTNVAGTREVFRLARACACGDWHLISSAYVCGRCLRAEERFYARPPRFHNDYEQSKWLAEQQAARAAGACGATLTLYRPAVIVGDSRRGVATRFVGVYYLFRAAGLLAREVAARGDVDRHRIPLRICAAADACPNLVFVDDVAREFGELFAQAAARGGVYHLTHPTPPSNARIKRALEAYYDIAGGRFVGARAGPPPAPRSFYERLFGAMTGAVAEYLFDAPRFDRSRVDRFVRRAPAAWTDERLRRLIAYASASGWRPARRPAALAEDGAGLAEYFQRFLPQRLPRSRIARLRRLDLDVRFVIAGSADGDWWCRFRGGQAPLVQRSGGRRADVTYRTSAGPFWRAVGGRTSGPELFLSGEADIEGDIERGLKFAMILREFVSEFPCERERLLADAARAG